MPAIFLGAASLIGVLVLVRLFVAANPRALAQAVRYSGVALLVAAAAALFYIRYTVLAFIALSMAWGLYTRGHIWPNTRPMGFFPFYRWFAPGNFPGGSRRGTRSGSQEPRSSRVQTAWLDLELHHETGEMEGMVLQGARANKALASLSPDELMALYDEAGAADAETARLLEAYFERRLGPEWRLKRQQQEQPKPDEEPRARSSRRDAGMSRDEAHRVLGLTDGASEDDIRAAHKRLMMQNHPDRGGSDYLAAKINEAKDVLLA